MIIAFLKLTKKGKLMQYLFRLESDNHFQIGPRNAEFKIADIKTITFYDTKPLPLLSESTNLEDLRSIHFSYIAKS